jgi:single-stranded-DNA-specific exonuclease
MVGHRSFMNMRWEMKTVDESDVERLSVALGLPRLVARVLCSRGFSEPSSALEFMKPSIERLHDPFLMADMGLAVKRIISALRNREVILIHGDYDADGICATALLSSKLSQWGSKVYWFIPDRFVDGYGVSMRAVNAAKSVGATLMITCDCGITSRKEVEYAMSLGIDTIIVDHHSPKGLLPRAIAILNPKRMDCKYPFKELSATGVALKLLCAVAEEGKFESPLNDELCLDLVGIATVADVVPLIGENRALAWHGLNALSKRSRVGLRKLMECAGLRSSRITGAHVSFIIAPRLNAPGRIEDPRDALRLLLARSETEAEALATRLDALNRERQDEEERVLEEALELVEERVDLSSELVIVLSSRRWHQGVIGIVASRLVELFHRPAILISVEGETGKGSCRSIQGFDITSALDFCSDLLVSYGGHQMAAGLVIREENIERLRLAINEIARRRLSEVELTPTLSIDAQAHPNELSLDVAHKMMLFEPCGCGNPKPTLALFGVKVIESNTHGKRHLRILADAHGTELEFVGYRMSHVADTVTAGHSIDLCFTLGIPHSDPSKLSLQIKALRHQSHR